MDRKNGLTPCSRTKSSGVVRPPPNGCCGGESIFKLTIVKLKVGSKTSVFTKFVLKQQKQPSFISTAWTLGVECKSSALYYYCCRRMSLPVKYHTPMIYYCWVLQLLLYRAHHINHHHFFSFFESGLKIKLLTFTDLYNLWWICPAPVHHHSTFLIWPITVDLF